MASKKKLQNQVAAATAEARVAAQTAVELETRNAGLEVALATASARLAAPPPPAPAAPAAPPPAPPPPPPPAPMLARWDAIRTTGSELEKGAFLAEHGATLRAEMDARAVHAKGLQTSAAPPAAAPPATPPRAPDGTFAKPSTPLLDRLHSLPTDLERATFMQQHEAALAVEVAATRGAGR